MHHMHDMTPSLLGTQLPTGNQVQPCAGFKHGQMSGSFARTTSPWTLKELINVSCLEASPFTQTACPHMIACAHQPAAFFEKEFRAGLDTTVWLPAEASNKQDLSTEKFLNVFEAPSQGAEGTYLLNLFRCGSYQFSSVRCGAPGQAEISRPSKNT